jgi:hypothetical protein
VLIELAPTLKAAELIAENNQRTNSLPEIAKCFQDACYAEFYPQNSEGEASTGKTLTSYDACLGNPALMADKCKVVLDRAGVKINNSDQTWNFVKAKLSALRVDACTTQVKECFESDSACTKDYSQCFGLDLEMVKKMCPISKLTACAENGKMPTDFDDKLDDMLTGLFLNIDNKMLEACEQAISEEVISICKDPDTCREAEAFTDELFGTEGMAIDNKTADEVIIMGLLDFSKIKIATTKTDEKGVTTQVIPYIEEVYDTQGEYIGVSRANAINIAQKINSVVNMIANNSKVSMCLFGRDMSQVRSDPQNIREGNFTQARTPRLFDSYAEMIIQSGLAMAKENYDKKLTKLKKEALTKMEEIAAATTNITDGALMCYSSDLPNWWEAPSESKNQ